MFAGIVWQARDSWLVPIRTSPSKARLRIKKIRDYGQILATATEERGD